MTDQTSRPRWRTRLLIGLASVAVVVTGIAVMTLRPAHYDPTPENEAATAQLTDGAITFVLLHEAGHMMIKMFDLPKIASEEDEADHFAGAMLTGAMDPNDPGAAQTRLNGLALFAAASYFDQMHKDNILHLRQPAWADEHGEPEQRAFNIVCLLYGRDQQWAKMARLSGLPPQRLRTCPDEAAKNQQGWHDLMAQAHDKNRVGNALESMADVTSPDDTMLDLLKPHTATPYLMPSSHKIGVYYNPVPDNLPPATKAMLLRGKRIAESGHAIPQVAEVMRLAPMPWILTDDRQDYAYKLVGDPCLVKDADPDDNAWWSDKTRTIVYCYRLMTEIEDNSRSIMANVAQRMPKGARPSV